MMKPLILLRIPTTYNFQEGSIKASLDLYWKSILASLENCRSGIGGISSFIYVAFSLSPLIAKE